MTRFEELNGTLASENLGYLFVYANQVTVGWFGTLMVLGFFLVVLIGSLMMQLRFRGEAVFKTSFLASCFATLGFATILEQVSGILNTGYFLVIILATIIAVIIIAVSSED